MPAPPVQFHGSTFRYHRCRACGSVFIDPIPDAATIMAMYPPTYQGEAQLSDNGRFQHHLALLKRFLPAPARVLDHGCGNGQLLALLRTSGYQADGTEYNPDYLPVLAKAFEGSTFYSAQDIAAIPAATYDCVALSNVLEHMADPGAILQQLKRVLKPGGFILADGPIEYNRSLVNRLVWWNYARKARQSDAPLAHPPYHFSFTTYQSQRDFFQRNGFTELHYIALEGGWPFPNSWGSAQGLGGKAKYAIVLLSKAWRALDAQVGNSFLYIGRKAD